MKLTAKGKSSGANEYEVTTDSGMYIGWLYRVYAPWSTMTRKIPAYEWHLDSGEDLDLADSFDTFALAKEYILSLDGVI